jgi:hypothetical protein
MTLFLQYTKTGDEEFLEGSYVSMNIRDSSNCGRGTVFLRKVPVSDFYEEPFVAKREKEVKKEAEAKKNTGTAKTGIPEKAGTGAKTGTTAKAGTSAKTEPPVKAGTTAKTEPPIKAGTTAKAGTTIKTGTAPRTGTIAKTDNAKPLPALSRVNMPKQALHTPGDSSSIGKKFPTITPRVLLSRSNQLVRSLTVHANEVVLNIYDDGAIDHDTISVYLDNKLVVDHAMLTDRPIVVILHLDESNDYHEVVMVAENEGEIPPNTSLMIVKAGDKEYEVRITSTEQKNAVVTFKFEKPK